MADNNFGDQTNLQTISNDYINYDYTYDLYYNGKSCTSNDANSRNIITFIKDNNEDNLYRSVQTFYIVVTDTQYQTGTRETCNNKGIDATVEDSNENVEKIYFSNGYIYIKLANNSNYSPNSYTYNFYIVFSDETFSDDDTNTNYYYPNSESISYYFNGRILPYEINNNFTNSISVNIYDKNVISSYSNIYELEETVKNACISKYGFAVNMKNNSNSSAQIQEDSIFQHTKHIQKLKNNLFNYYKTTDTNDDITKFAFYNDLNNNFNISSNYWGKIIGAENLNNLENTGGNSGGNSGINIYFYNSTLQKVFTDNFGGSNPYTYINTRPVNIDPNSSTSNLFDSLEMLHMLIAKKYSDYDYD